MKVTVDTKFNADAIICESSIMLNDHVQRLSRVMIRLRDDQVRSALIELGWTPPTPPPTSATTTTNNEENIMENIIDNDSSKEEKIMKDIFGNDLAVGDVVAFNQPGYKSLIIGRIVKLNPRQLRIWYKGGETSEWPQNVVKKIDPSNQAQTQDQ